MTSVMRSTLRFAIPVAIGVVLWFLPTPEEVDPKGVHLLAIFIATIIGIILKPLPMGAVAAIGICATAATGTLTINQALTGFGNRVIWLIVLAFFISRGFISATASSPPTWCLHRPSPATRLARAASSSLSCGQ
jgi:di/tricarboxylate transporter